MQVQGEICPIWYVANRVTLPVQLRCLPQFLWWSCPCFYKVAGFHPVTTYRVSYTHPLSSMACPFPPKNRFKTCYFTCRVNDDAYLDVIVPPHITICIRFMVTLGSTKNKSHVIVRFVQLNIAFKIVVHSFGTLIYRATVWRSKIHNKIGCGFEPLLPAWVWAHLVK